MFLRGTLVRSLCVEAFFKYYTRTHVEDMQGSAHPFSREYHKNLERYGTGFPAPLNMSKGRATRNLVISDVLLQV